MSINHDNELAAATGGRSYLNCPRLTAAQQRQKASDDRLEALRIRLMLADRAAPKVHPSKAYKDLDD